MLEVCALELRRMTGLEVSPGELDESRIEDHFRFMVRVENREGEVLANGRDLAGLQERLGQKAQRRFMDRQGAGYNRDGEKSWTFGELETRITTGGGTIAFPALVDQDDAVGLRLFDTWEEAAHSHAAGVIRLLRIHLPDKLRYLGNHHGLGHASQMTWSSIDSPSRLVADLVLRCLVDTAGDLGGIRTESDFDSLCKIVRRDIGRTVQKFSAILDESLRIYGKLAPRVYGGLENSRPEAFADISTQLEDLFYPGFLGDLFPGRLEHYPRYLRALEERLAHLAQDPVRDSERMGRIEPWWSRYLGALESGHPYDEAMDAFRWLIEEYRVSVFAQRLRTAEKVSEKRLDDAWQRTGC